MFMIVLPQYRLPLVQTLRRRLGNGRHVSLRVDNLRQISVVSIDVRSVPHKVLQPLEGTHHGETSLSMVYRHARVKQGL